MINYEFLTTEAKLIHSVFIGIFYSLCVLFILISVILENFKLSMGKYPDVTSIVGRTLIAVLLLNVYPEIANTVAEIVDVISAKIGDLNKVNTMLEYSSKRLDSLTFSWLSAKDLGTFILFYIGHFVLYLSMYVANGIQMFILSVCYVFSPILIAMYIIPATSSATKSLFRTLFEVSSWKIIWTVIATLLWGGIMEIMQGSTEGKFIETLSMNICLAGAMLLTPFVVRSLVTTGLSGFTNTVGSLKLGGATLGPKGALIVSRVVAGRAWKVGKYGYKLLKAKKRTKKTDPGTALMVQDNTTHQKPKFKAKEKPTTQYNKRANKFQRSKDPNTLRMTKDRKTGTYYYKKPQDKK